MNGIQIYGIISVCIFALVFTGAMIWAGVQKKSFLKSMSALPLDEGDTPAQPKENSHE